MVRGRRLSRRLHHFLSCSLFWLRWRLGVSCLRFRIRPLQFSPRTVHRNSVDSKCRRVSTWIRWHMSTRPARWIDRLRWTLKTSFTASRGTRSHCFSGDYIHTVLPRPPRSGVWFIDLRRQLSTWIPSAALCSLIHSWLKGFLEENKKQKKKKTFKRMDT